MSESGNARATDAGAVEPAPKRERALDAFDYSRGIALFRNLFGPELGAELARGGQYAGDTFRQVVWAGIGPEIWERPSLNMRTKVLLLVGMFAVMGRPEIKLFMRAAFHHGVTRAEIEDILLLAGLEAGMPNAAAGFARLAEAEAEQAAFDQRGSEPAHGGPDSQ
jgi:4-carboxymuconolactone decarboxylase